MKTDDTNNTVTLTTEGVNIKGGNITIQTQENLPDANPKYNAPLTEESLSKSFEQVAQPTTVQAVNKAVLEAGEMELTPKQQEKKDKEDKKYWNGMITRKELAGILQEQAKDTEQRMQILYVQNATLLEVFKAKGLVDEQDMIDASKKVMEELFGILPEDLEGAVQEASNEETSN